MSGLDDVTWADGHFASVVQDPNGAVLHFVDHEEREHALRFDGCLWLEVGTGWADDVEGYKAFNEAAEIVRANAELIAAGGLYARLAALQFDR